MAVSKHGFCVECWISGGDINYLVVQGPGAEILYRIPVHASRLQQQLGHPSPWISRGSGISSHRRISLTDRPSHEKVGEYEASSHQSTAAHSHQPFVPFEWKPGLDIDLVILAGMGVRDSNVTVIDIVDVDRGVVVIISVRDISAVIGNQITSQRKNLGAKERRIWNLARRAERSERGV